MSGLTQYKPSLASVTKIVNGDNATGFCLACGKKQAGVEPDARKYTCLKCGAPKVYGAEELLVMGLTH
jgi:hypothetical protein